MVSIHCRFVYWFADDTLTLCHLYWFFKFILHQYFSGWMISCIIYQTKWASNGLPRSFYIGIPTFARNSTNAILRGRLAVYLIRQKWFEIFEPLTLNGGRNRQKHFLNQLKLRDTYIWNIVTEEGPISELIYTISVFTRLCSWDFQQKF